MKTPHQILTEAYEYIRDPDRWCQGNRWSGLEFQKNCAFGAVERVCGKRPYEVDCLGPWHRDSMACQLLDRAALEFYAIDDPIHKVCYNDGSMWATWVNDQYGHEAICKVFERAIEMAAEPVEAIKKNAITNNSSDEGWFGAPVTSAIKIEDKEEALT